MAVAREFVVALGLLSLGCDRPKDVESSPATADVQPAEPTVDPTAEATSEAPEAAGEPESPAEPEPVDSSRSAADALEDALPDDTSARRYS